MFGPRIDADPVRWQASSVIEEAIEAFWAAWPRVRSVLAGELASGSYGEGTERLTELVEGIEPSLEWELMPGRAATTALCVSSAADPRLRLLTELWVRLAPPSDDEWEFHPGRVAVGLEPLELNGVTIDPAAATVGIEPDVGAETLDIIVGHPDFAGLDETLQLQAAFRFLDDLLGEDDAERWIGSVEVFHDEVRWGIPFSELAQSVELLAAAASGEQWEAIDQQDLELGRSELVINRALKRLDMLDLTMLMTVSIEIPGREDVSLADAVEDDLAAVLGSDGVIFARETYDNFVVTHAYGREAKVPPVSRLAERHGPAVYDIVTEADPGWDAYDEMR